MCRAAADAKNKLSDDFSPTWRVGDFRMELNTVPWFLIVGDGCEGSIGGVSNNVEAGGDF